MRTVFRTLEQKIDPRHAALVIIDMQNDMCSPQGSFARMGFDVSPLAAVAPLIVHMADLARESGVLTIYTRVSDRDLRAVSDAYYEANLAFYERQVGREVKKAGDVEWTETTWGEEFFPPIQPTNKDVVILKHRFGAFAHTKLEQVLRSNLIRTLVFGGVLTDVCLESTARAAIDLDYYVVIAADCTATLTEERQRASLAIMGNIIGTLATSHDIGTIWMKSRDEV